MSQNVAKLDDGTEAHLKTGGEQITFTNKTVAGSIDDECGKVFQLLKIRRKHRFIVYKIDSATDATRSFLREDPTVECYTDQHDRILRRVLSE